MFDWNDFLILLNPSVMTMAAIVGLAFGLVVRSLRQREDSLIFWMAMSGTMFFIPLSVIRALQGSPTWDRWLSSLVLWLLYSGATYCGSRLLDWTLTRKR